MGGALKVEEKKLNTIEHAELLKIVVNQKKAELEDLQHKILLAKNNFRSIEDGCRKTQSDFNQQLAIEKQKLERLKNQKLNEFAQRDESLLQGEREQNTRLMRLQEKEGNQLKLDTERKAIYQQRLELEKTNADAKAELENTRALQSEAENKINQATQKETDADKKLAEAKQANSSAEFQLNQLIEKEKGVKADLENIQKIRNEITPKIAELEALDKKNEAKLAEIIKREDEVNGKAIENEKVMENIKAADAVLDKKKITIAEREEAVTRQEIIIKNLKEKNG